MANNILPVPCQVGFAETSDETWKLTSPFFPSKLGGKPAWLSLKLPNVAALICGNCSKPLTFLLQLYAPSCINSISAFHRTLFVFVCRSSKCSKQGKFPIKIFRTQLSRQNDFYDYEPPNYDTPPAGNETDNLTAAFQSLCILCGLPGPNKCSKCKQSSYCSRDHQIIHWKLGHKSVCEQETSTVVVSSMPNVAFPEYEIETESEYYDANSTSATKSDKERMKEYEEFIAKAESSLQDLKSSAADDQLDDLSAFCDGVDDKMFRKFKERIAQQPEQIIRYHRDGDILWVSSEGQMTGGDLEVPNCPKCASKRTFEFQIMPQLLNYLDVDSMDDSSLDWGTIVVFTCSSDCDIGDSYVEEFAWIQQFSSTNSTTTTNDRLEENDAVFDSWLREVTLEYLTLTPDKRLQTLLTLLKCSSADTWRQIQGIEKLDHKVDYFDLLPSELVDRVCSFLDLKSIESCLLVSKTWCRKIKLSRSTWIKILRHLRHSFRDIPDSFCGVNVDDLRQMCLYSNNKLSSFSAGCAFETSKVSLSEPNDEECFPTSMFYNDFKLAVGFRRIADRQNEFGEVRIYDCFECPPVLLASITMNTAPSDLKFDQSILVTGCLVSRSAFSWNIDTGTQMKSFGPHPNGVTLVDFNIAHNVVVTAYHVMRMALWSLSTGAMIRTFEVDWYDLDRFAATNDLISIGLHEVKERINSLCLLLYVSSRTSNNKPTDVKLIVLEVSPTNSADAYIRPVFADLESHLYSSTFCHLMDKIQPTRYSLTRKTYSVNSGCSAINEDGSRSSWLSNCACLVRRTSVIKLHRAYMINVGFKFGYCSGHLWNVDFSNWTLMIIDTTAERNQKFQPVSIDLCGDSLPVRVKASSKDSSEFSIERYCANSKSDSIRPGHVLSLAEKTELSLAYLRAGRWQLLCETDWLDGLCCRKEKGPIFAWATLDSLFVTYWRL